MRKGFLHVVEIIIVGLMAFFVILQFSYLPKQDIDWGGMKLSIQANDILFSLEKRDVDWLNSSEVGSAISSFVSNNTIFNLKIRNVMKPQISVGCICSGPETTALANALGHFEVNGQPVGFTVNQIGSIVFSHEYDVIVINDSGLAGHYDQIRQFLAADKSIVEFRGLSESEIDSVQTDLFGLVWNSSLPNSNTDSVEFRSAESPEPYFNIYKYFHNIPLYQENFTSSAANWNTQIGSWSVNSQNYMGDSGASPEAVSFYNMQFQDTYLVRMWLKFDTAARAKIILYRQDADDYVAVDFNRGADSVTVYNNVSGLAIDRGSASCTLGATDWYDVSVVSQPDSSLKIYLNNSLILASEPVNTLPSSQIGLGVAGGVVRFDNVRVVFAGNHNFSGSMLQSEKIRPADNRAQKVILLQRQGGEEIPACIVNSNIADGRGRTAWLAYSDPAASQDISNILRTLVIWGAGEENEVVKNDVMNVPVVTSLYKVYDQDMYQPVEIVLTMGNLYG